jgi:hypothetical protein
MLPAILASLALFVWPAWVLTAKMARMDTAALCFLLIASILICRCLCRETGFRPVVLFLSGLSVSVSGFFHPASFTWSLSLLVVIALFSSRRFISTAVYCAGAAVVVGAWLAYATQYPDAFEIQFVTSLTNRAGIGSPSSRFAEEGIRYFLELKRMPMIVPAAALALVGLTMGSRRSDRHLHFLIVLAAVLICANAMIAGKSSGFYTLYPMLLILCLISIGIAECVSLGGGAAKGGAALVALIVYGLFVTNEAAWSSGPRLLALVLQSKVRNYDAVFEPLSEVLKPGDEVWGSATAWYAVVKAGARIDSKSYPIPIKWNTHPNPDRHRFIVTELDETNEFLGFRKVANFGIELKPVLGSPLSSASYVFELWKSQRLK